MYEIESVIFNKDMKNYFVKQTPKLFQQMYDGLHKGNAYEIKRAAHNFKVNCYDLGLEEMAVICRCVEDSVNKGLGGQSEIAVMLQKLERAYDERRWN